MTTFDTFPATRRAQVSPIVAPLLTAVLLLLLMGVPALMAPPQTAALDWHGNAATSLR